MEIITSHNSLDFDGLAAMVAAGKLHPDAVKVFSGSLKPNVKQFMGLYKDSLNIRGPGDVRLPDVTRVILVDTRNANRLGQLAGLKAYEPQYIVYDHHPEAPGDVKARQSEVAAVGATTTILVEIIRRQGIKLTPFEATILALGIYEDTGSLLFGSTTASDAAAVAYLIEQGANLNVVNQFMDAPFTSDQRLWMQEFMGNLRHHAMNGLDIAVTTHSAEDYVPGLDMVVHRLFEVEACDAVFAVAMMQGRAYVIARSRNANVAVNEILTPMGGAGHDKAASAIVKRVSAGTITEQILDEIRAKAKPGLVARNIMSTPVKTIPMDYTMEEAERIMLRYGHTGMPVVEHGELIGIISRRDVDKAKTHKLSHAPVKGFMSRTVVSVGEDTPVSEIQRMMVGRDIGRVPVVTDGNLVGIVSRTDVLRTLHGEQVEDEYTSLYTEGKVEPEGNYRRLMEERLPERIFRLFMAAGQVASDMEYRIYVVGGFVRDLLLGVPNFDLDLVVEGDGIEFAVALAARLGGRIRMHDRFKTAVVILEDGAKVDVATARTEYYEFPAALPTVESSSIKEDLYRRDFTINTMAICLNPDRFGSLIDYFGGKRDLNDGLIRVLHSFSFIEDPTRMLRAVRFEQRYGFTVEADTLRNGREAMRQEILGRLSYRRLQQELVLILGENDPRPALERMAEFGIWHYVLPEVTLTPVLLERFHQVGEVLSMLAENGEPYGLGRVKRWLAFVAALVSELDAEAVTGILERYHFDREAKKTITGAIDVPDAAQTLATLPSLKPSDIDRTIGGYTSEQLTLLLACINHPEAELAVLDYLAGPVRMKADLTGEDLKKMGIKPGPVYSVILAELHRLRIDGIIQTRDAEIGTVKQWLEEGKIDVWC